MLYEDIEERKWKLNEKCEEGEESLKYFDKLMTESKDITTAMVTILKTFETRLASLEERILPLYSETETLQRRGKHVTRTLQALDDVIAYYSVSKDVEDLIEYTKNTGISLSNSEGFFDAMNRLKEALEYFTHNNPVLSIEIENVKSLFEAGIGSFNREFSEFVKKHSMSLSVTDLLSSSETLETFPREEQTILIIAIAEWLHENQRDEFLRIYASLRASFLKKSLENLKKYQNKRKEDIVLVSPPNISSRSRLSLKMMTASIRSSSDDGFSPESELEYYCQTVTVLQKLMRAEQRCMIGIIPPLYQRKVFERIVRDSLDDVVSSAETIVTRLKKCPLNSGVILPLLVSHRQLMAAKESFESLLDSVESSIRSKYNCIHRAFLTSASSTLEDFIETIRTDSTSKMPKDGTVFQLTSNVLLFLEQISSDFIDTLAIILTDQNSSYNQSLLHLDQKISVVQRNEALFGLYIKKVLVQLNLTLIQRSEAYTDLFLKAIFRLNNNQYILKSLQKSGLLSIVSLIEPECKDTYNEMILEQKRLYSQSWAKIISHIFSDSIPISILHSPGKLHEKYCRMIKDKFAGFNKEMEEVSNTQKTYSIPDVELREALKRDNKEYILPKYSAFYERYVNINFSKHPEKYVKYTPTSVSSLIDTFFDATA